MGMLIHRHNERKYAENMTTSESLHPDMGEENKVQSPDTDPEQVEPETDDERPFKCPHCDKTYKEQGYLDAHITKVHKE